MGGALIQRPVFYNREWRQRLRSMSQKHPGWVHQLLNSAPRTLRDDSCCQPCVPPCPPHSCCLREPSWPLKGRITTFYDPKNSIPFFSGKHFLREIRFMQRLGTRKENDPFGGEKRIPPSYFVVRFDSVLLQCICNICSVCYWGRPYVIIDGQSWAVVIIQSLFYPHGKKVTPLHTYTHTRIECVSVRKSETDEEEGGEMGETHFCCSSFSWNISHEYWQQLCCRRQKEMNRGCWSQRQHTVWESLARVTARSTARDNLNLSY